MVNFSHIIVAASVLALPSHVFAQSASGAATGGT